jgi:hypothetical protein
MVAVVEIGQISCPASQLQGIQMIAASDFQRVITAVEAAAMVEVTIAELRMEFTVQKSPDCFAASSRRMLLACLAGFARRLIQVIMRTRITLEAGFASRLLLQKIGCLLWKVAAVQKLKNQVQVAMIAAGADRKYFERLEISRKTLLQIAMLATVRSFLRSLKCPDLLLRIWIMAGLHQMANFEFVLLPFLRIHQHLDYQSLQVGFVVNLRTLLLEYQCCLR